MVPMFVSARVYVRFVHQFSFRGGADKVSRACMTRVFGFYMCTAGAAAASGILQAVVRVHLVRTRNFCTVTVCCKVLA